jgi:hypothetical protein
MSADRNDNKNENENKSKKKIWVPENIFCTVFSHA